LKILVTVKRGEDPESRIAVRPDGQGIVTEGVAYKINPFDEIAVEEALRLSERYGGEVVAVSVGPETAETQVRQALALGAQRGLFVRYDGPTDPDLVSRLLAAVVTRELPDLVLMGKQAIDDDQGQVGGLLAERLGWGLVSFASKAESLESEAEKRRATAFELAGSVIRVSREVDGGLETLEADLPAVVTADLRLNKPRLPVFKNIMKAKKDPIPRLTPQDLGVDTSLKVRVTKWMPPSARKGGTRVPDVVTLVRKLKDEAKIL